MPPTWLTIELALLPLAIAVLGTVIGGIVAAVRLEGKVKKAQSDADRAGADCAELRSNQGTHNNELYSELRHLSACTHLMMGSMGLKPPEQR